MFPLAQEIAEPSIKWLLTDIGPYVGLFSFMAALLWRCYSTKQGKD